MMETSGKPIQCKAAVCWEINKPLVVEIIEVAPPKLREVRIKVLFTAVCHSDTNYLDGSIPGRKPVILGHESAGVIESIGEGVTDFKPGDHVIPLFVPQCGDCRSCKSEKTNICDEFRGKNYSAGLMADGTSRFTYKGQKVHHMLNCSAFSQYTVVPDISVCKIDSTTPLNKVCLLGCGVATGYGAALNTAKVENGSTCAVWGLGPIGLAVVMGCKKSGASRIIGIDINSDKLKLDWKGKRDIPKLIKGYTDKEFLLDEFVTHIMGLVDINDAFNLMREGKGHPNSVVKDVVAHHCDALCRIQIDF